MRNFPIVPYITKQLKNFRISNAGEDGESNYEIWINYEFKIIKEEENPLDTVIEITDICLL